MPSPRWPSRTIASRSVKLHTEQEFAVSLAAQNGRGDYVDHVPSEQLDIGAQVIADRCMDIGVADQALLHMATAHFELRLDQRDELRRPLDEQKGRGQGQLQ